MYKYLAHLKTTWVQAKALVGGGIQIAINAMIVIAGIIAIGIMCTAVINEAGIIAWHWTSCSRWIKQIQ